MIWSKCLSSGYQFSKVSRPRIGQVRVGTLALVGHLAAKAPIKGAGI